MKSRGPYRCSYCKELGHRVNACEKYRVDKHHKNKEEGILKRAAKNAFYEDVLQLCEKVMQEQFQGSAAWRLADIVKHNLGNRLVYEVRL